MIIKYLFLAVSLFLVPCVMVQDLEQRVEVLEGEVLRITDDVDDVETDVSQNTGQLFEVMNDVDDIDDLSSEQEQKIEALEGENSLLRMELEQNKARLDQLEQMFNSLSGDVEVLNETFGNLDTDNSTNERLDVLESDIRDLEINIISVETTVQDLDETTDQRLSDLEGNIADLDESTDQRLSDLESNIAGNSDTIFLATISAETISPNDPIVFDNAILNPGGHYSTTLGVYTVPLDGIYQFVLHYTSFNDEHSGAWLEVDNVRVVYISVADYVYPHLTADLVIVQSLTAGQQVWISPNGMNEIAGTHSTGHMFSWFSGHLIFAL